MLQYYKLHNNQIQYVFSKNSSAPATNLKAHIKFENKTQNIKLCGIEVIKTSDVVKK